MKALGDKSGVAAALVNIGNAHLMRGDLDEALASLERGLELAEQIGQGQWAVNALDIIGRIHSRRGDHEKALATHEQALERKQALGDKAGTAETLASIGETHRALGDYTEARTFAEKGRRAARSLRSSSIGWVNLNSMPVRQTAESST